MLDAVGHRDLSGSGVSEPQQSCRGLQCSSSALRSYPIDFPPTGRRGRRTWTVDVSARRDQGSPLPLCPWPSRPSDPTLPGPIQRPDAENQDTAGRPDRRGIGRRSSIDWTAPSPANEPKRGDVRPGCFRQRFSLMTCFSGAVAIEGNPANGSALTAPFANRKMDQALFSFLEMILDGASCSLGGSALSRFGWLVFRGVLALRDAA